MSQTVNFNLALILFLPTFCIVSALYCWLPTKPRSGMRWIVDLIVIVVAFALSILAMRWGFRRAEGVGSPIWRQAASTLASYAVFLGVLGLGAIGRGFWLRRLGRVDGGVPSR